MDPLSRREFWDLIYTLAGEGVSVLATTHYMDEADYCNVIGMMYQGELISLASPDEIKDEFPGVLVQVDCDRPGDASEMLQHLAEVQSVSVHGAQIHVTFGDGEKAKKIEKTLAQAGFDVRSAEIVQPSVEDAFIAMVAQRRSQAPATPGQPSI